MNRLVFPENFLWGAATSAFQIEGATEADGRGESIWDRFAATAGKIEDGTDGRVACEHYRRWKDDLGLLSELDVNAYRFSVAWPRVLPDGTGRVNEAGLAFYDRLVDGLLERGIKPFLTLYHWDLPQVLQDAGGWPARATVDAFERYTDVVTRRLGDRVKDWVTHNEPWCISSLGYLSGEHAPGHKNYAESLAAAHHLLLSHGRAMQVIRANVPQSRAGIVLNLVPSYPASPSASDAAALQAFDGIFNRWFLDPIYRGAYPEDVIAHHLAEKHVDGFPFIQAGDLATIAQKTDFLGVNYYSRAICRSALPEAENAPRTIADPPASVRTDMGWEVFPQGLTDLLVRLQNDYAPGEIFITENGAAYATAPDESGRVRDEARQAYVESHLAACHAAIAAGVPLSGYFVWSLMDNFEWAFGYTKRFGVVWVDYATQRRIIKDSGRWYAGVARANAMDGGHS